MSEWPSDAVMLVCPRPEEAVIVTSEPTVPVSCRRCGVGCLARQSSIDRARCLPDRRGRPLAFFCIACALQHDRSSIEVFEDLRPRDELDVRMDQVLIESLSPEMKAVLDRLLARGVAKPGLLAAVEVMVRRAAGGDLNRGRLTMAAIEAYVCRRGGSHAS